MNERIPGGEGLSDELSERVLDENEHIDEKPVPQEKPRVKRYLVESFEELFDRAKDANRARLWDKSLKQVKNEQNGQMYWDLADVPDEFFDANIYRVSDRKGGQVEINVSHPTEKDPHRPERRLWVRTIGVTEENFSEWKIDLGPDFSRKYQHTWDEN